MEIGSVADGEQDLCCGLDADPWHAHQDLGKREVIKHFFHLLSDGIALVFERFDVFGQLWDDGFGSITTWYGDGLCF